MWHQVASLGTIVRLGLSTCGGLPGAAHVTQSGAATVRRGYCHGNLKAHISPCSSLSCRAKQRARRRSRGEGSRTGSAGLPTAPGTDGAVSSIPAGKGQQAAAADDIAAGNGKAGKTL